MLGVKKHPLAPAGQIAAGILDHAQVFLQGRAQDLSHMKVPAFAEHRHDRGVGGKQRPDVAVILRLDPLAAGGACFRWVSLTRRKNSRSLGFEPGFPASINVTPSSSSFCTIASLSSTEKEIPSPWAPSLRVESKISTDRSMMLFLSIILQIVFSVKISNFAPAV